MGKATEYTRVEVDKLIPYVNNAKQHSDSQVTKIASSIREFGFLNPVLIDASYNVIAGHGRILAAKKLGLSEVPCLFVEGLSDAQRKAYILADNRLSELGEWDMELVMGELAELDDLGFDTELTGFEFEVEPEITDDEGDVPEPPTEPKAKLGDLYQLGRHRLICGDSTDVNVIERLMGGQKADVTFTSPPYNGDNGLPDGDVFAGRKSKRLYGDGYKDSLASSEYVDFCKRALEVCFENTDGFIFWNVNYNAKSRSEYIKQIEDRLDYLIEQIAWVKSSAIPLQGTMRRAWEPVYMFSTNTSLITNLVAITRNEQYICLIQTLNITIHLNTQTCLWADVQ